MVLDRQHSSKCSRSLDWSCQRNQRSQRRVLLICTPRRTYALSARRDLARLRRWQSICCVIRLARPVAFTTLHEFDAAVVDDVQSITVADNDEYRPAGVCLESERYAHDWTLTFFNRVESPASAAGVQ